MIGARRLSDPRGSDHSGHGPARSFPARWEHLPRVGHHNMYPDDAPARGGGPGRRLEPPADPGLSPTKVKTGIVRWAPPLLGSLCRLVHAGPSPTRSLAMISRPPKAVVGWTRRMLLLALSVVLLGTARAAGTSASSCSLDKVLISNTVDAGAAGAPPTIVDVRAVGHCHQNANVADILKTASVRRSSGQVSMVSRLTQSRNKEGAYKRSCRKGIWQSIRFSGDINVVADMSMLVCFCALARTFVTDIVRDGNSLIDGDNRGEFEFVGRDKHQFNDDGTQMCKEFRRRAISNCMSHTIGNTEMGFTDLSLTECCSATRKKRTKKLTNCRRV